VIQHISEQASHKHHKESTSSQLHAVTLAVTTQLLSRLLWLLNIQQSNKPLYAMRSSWRYSAATAAAIQCCSSNLLLAIAAAAGGFQSLLSLSLSSKPPSSLSLSLSSSGSGPASSNSTT
jgi:hypothetical protein